MQVVDAPDRQVPLQRPEARIDVQVGTIPPPKPPTRDEIRVMSSERAAHYAAQRAVRAIKAEFDHADAPF